MAKFVLSFLACLFFLASFSAGPEAQAIVPIASRYVGITERGSNRGPDIDRWNRAVGAPLGSSYCASAVSAWLTESGARTPSVRSARSRAFVVKNSKPVADVFRGRARADPGDLIVWERTGGGHIGVVTQWSGLSGRTIEANTSSGVRGSQFDGGGVFARIREISPHHSRRFRVTHFTPVSY